MLQVNTWKADNKTGKERGTPIWTSWNKCTMEDVWQVYSKGVNG